MSNHSVIEHRASYYYVKLEEDYLAICSGGECSPHCKAFILSILEHWMNTKRAKGEGDYVYLTMPQWIKHMYMLYERNVVTDCIHELIEESLIKRRPITVHDQETFEYTLCIDAIHQRLKQLPSKQPKETLPNLDGYLSFKERGKAKRAKKKEGVRENSPTQEVSEKSRTVRENSPRVGEKSTTGYVKNQSNVSSVTQLPSASTEGETQPESEATETPSSPSPEKKILSPEVTAILDMWDEIEGESIPRTEKQIKAAKSLTPCHPTKENLIAVKDFCLTSNPKWYAVQGVDLTAIANNWGKWKSVQKTPTRKENSKPEAATQPKPENDLRALARRQKELAATKGRIY